jgi:hypothetical protein
MMKEPHAMQLGNQIGKFIRMDGRFPGYLRVRVDFPLAKALMPSLTVRIKGRGAMVTCCTIVSGEKGLDMLWEIVKARK